MVFISQGFYLHKLSYLLRAPKLYRYVPREIHMLGAMSMLKNGVMESSPQANKSVEGDAKKIFKAAIDSVLPGVMVKKAIRLENDKLIVNGIVYPLNRNVHIIGFGKAVMGMARAVEDLLGDHVVAGIISVPFGLCKTLQEENKLDMMVSPDSRIRVYEGAVGNIPDDGAHQAAMAIYQLAKSLTKQDLCITLITGGGSALLPATIPPISLSEIADVTRILSRSGATIKQLNTVRKQLELLKGGGLASVAQPAKIVALILSDVIGNELDSIASGPTCDDMSSPQQCLDLFKLFKIEDQIPISVQNFLETSATRRLMIQEKKRLGMLDYDDDDGDDDDVAIKRHDVSKVQNVIIGSNAMLVENTERAAQEMGYLTYVLSLSLNGEAQIVGEIFADLTTFVCLTMGNNKGRDMQRSLVREEMELLRKGVSKEKVNTLLVMAKMAANQDKPMCIIAGGETVVTVKGTGEGGRNQELAMWTAFHLRANNENYDLTSRFDVEFLSAGTDGQDGMTDAAGAVVSLSTCVAAEESDLDMAAYLENNDSHTFFSVLKGGKEMVRTGYTGTNVMDLQVLLIKNIAVNKGD